MSALELPSRIPPHNLDAERAVLGAILLEGREALPRVVEVLRPPDFYTEAHRSIYYAMQNLFDRGEPVDLLTLQEELRRTDQLPLVGGPAALALLVEQGSVAAYLTSYTAIVRDMAVLRELIQTSTHIITQAFDAKEDVQSLVDDAEALRQRIEALTLEERRQASEEGKLFGSVTSQDIVDFLDKHGVKVERRRIQLDEPIKTLGDTTVPIRVHQDVTAQLKVTVARSE